MAVVALWFQFTFCRWPLMMRSTCAYRSFIFAVRVAVDMGWERIHKERKMHRAKFYSLSKRGKGRGMENYAGPEALVFWAFIGYKGLRGVFLLWVTGLLEALQCRRFCLVLRKLQFAPMFFACGCGEWLVMFCSCLSIFSYPGDISSEELNGSHV